MNMSMDMPAIIGLGSGYLNGFSGRGRSFTRSCLSLSRVSLGFSLSLSLGSA